MLETAHNLRSFRSLALKSFRHINYYIDKNDALGIHLCKNVAPSIYLGKDDVLGIHLRKNDALSFHLGKGRRSFVTIEESDGIGKINIYTAQTLRNALKNARKRKKTAKLQERFQI